MEIITLKQFIIQIRARWVLVVSCLIISVLFGFFIYKLTPKGYRSTVQFFAADHNEQRTSGLGGLANLAGININTATQGLPPQSYEYILKSSLFLADVANERILFEDKEVPIINYINQRMIVGWKPKFRKLFSNKTSVLKEDSVNFFQDSISTITSEEVPNLAVLDLPQELLRAVRILRQSITYQQKSNEPFLVELNLQHPEASARILEVMIKKLNAYVKQYSQDRNIDNTEFLNREADKAKAELYKTQTALAALKDQNLGVIWESSKIEIQQLEQQYALALRNYNRLADQLDHSKINTEKERLLLYIIEPPSILSIENPSEPRLVIYLIISIFIGLFSSISIILLSSFYKRNFK